jgi:hypothetical protein
MRREPPPTSSWALTNLAMVNSKRGNSPAFSSFGAIPIFQQIGFEHFIRVALPPTRDDQHPEIAGGK